MNFLIYEFLINAQPLHCFNKEEMNHRFRKAEFFEDWMWNLATKPYKAMPIIKA